MPVKLADFEQEMYDTIKSVDEFSKRRGEIGGLITKVFPLFDQHTEGLQEGLILIGGQPNSGKTAFMIQTAWQIAQNNNAYVIYFSLDDPVYDALNRVVACDQRIPINAARLPKRYPYCQGRRKAGIERLYKYVSHFKMIDKTAGSSLQFIEETIKRHAIELNVAEDGRRLAVFIDGLYDITLDEGGKLEGNDKYELIVLGLDRIAQHYKCPIVCSAEFRKLNKAKRPNMEDLRETVKIAYKAKMALLIYNEVHVRGNMAKIYHTVDGVAGKQPVLEVHFGKNKFTSFKGRLFYRFFPNESYLEEIPWERARKFEDLIT